MSYTPLPDIASGLMQGVAFGQQLKQGKRQQARQDEQYRAQKMQTRYQGILDGVYNGLDGPAIQEMETGFFDEFGDEGQKLYGKKMPSFLVNNKMRKSTEAALKGVKEGTLDQSTIGNWATDIWQDQADKVVGQANRFGGTITGSKFKEALLNEDDTVSFLYDWTGTDADGNDVTWSAPISEQRLSDPNDPPRRYKIPEIYSDLANRAGLGQEMAMYQDAWKRLTKYVDPNSGKIEYEGHYYDPDSLMELAVKEIPQIHEPYQAPVVNEFTGETMTDQDGNPIMQTKYRKTNAYSLPAAMAWYTDPGFREFAHSYLAVEPTAMEPGNRDVLYQAYVANKQGVDVPLFGGTDKEDRVAVNAAAPPPSPEETKTGESTEPFKPNPEGKGVLHKVMQTLSEWVDSTGIQKQNPSAIAQPGGLMSPLGMQQVAGRPTAYEGAALARRPPAQEEAPAATAPNQPVAAPLSPLALQVQQAQQLAAAHAARKPQPGAPATSESDRQVAEMQALLQGRMPLDSGETPLLPNQKPPQQQKTAIQSFRDKLMGYQQEVEEHRRNLKNGVAVAEKKPERKSLGQMATEYRQDIDERRSNIQRQEALERRQVLEAEAEQSDVNKLRALLSKVDYKFSSAEEFADYLIAETRKGYRYQDRATGATTEASPFSESFRSRLYNTALTAWNQQHG